MNKDKSVFAQLVEFLNNKFRHLVNKYNGNRYVKWRRINFEIRGYSY